MILFLRQRVTASLFVNNRFGTIYGSNCLDCHYALRDWPRLWPIYLVKETPPGPTPVHGVPGESSPTASIASPTPLAAPAVAPKAAEPVASFPEKIETLRNSDVELRLTHRGGATNEATLCM